MNFSLFVSAAPGANIERSTALLTAAAILGSEHNLYRVFFYDAGVQHCGHASSHGELPWQALVRDTTTDLCFCSASVKKYQVALSSHTNVSLGGLVQLLDAQMNSDRIVSLS